MKLIPRQRSSKSLFLASSMLVTPFLAVMASSPAFADCTVTSGGGTVADPNDNGTITCTTTGGSHTSGIGNNESNLTIDVQTNAVVDITDSHTEISDTRSATITLQSGSQATITPYDEGDGKYSGGEGFIAGEFDATAVSQDITLYDNATLSVMARAVYTWGNDDGGDVDTTVTLSGNNSRIEAVVPAGGESSSNVTAISNRNLGDGGATVTVTLSGDNATIYSYDDSSAYGRGPAPSLGINNNSRNDSNGAVTSDTTVTLSGAGAQIYSGGTAINATASGGGGTGASNADVDVTLSGDNSSIYALNGSAVSVRSSKANSAALATVTLSGDGAHINAGSTQSGYYSKYSDAAISVRGQGSTTTAQATVTLESDTSVVSTGPYGIYVYGGEKSFGGEGPPPSPASNPTSTIDNAGLISAIDNSLMLHNGDDSVTLRTGSNLSSSSGADAGDGTDTLTLIGTATEDEIFLNFENLDMDGTDWTLSGNSTFTDIDVNSGILKVGGTLTGPVDVAEGANLGGTGTIVGNVTNGGQVTPGDSFGTLNITGDFTQNSDDELIVEFDGLNTAVLDVSGTATLAGTVTFVEVNHGLSDGATVTFLNAGTLSGSFSTVNFVPTVGSNLVSATVNQVGNDLEVTFNGGGAPNPCVLFSGTGTVAVPADGDSIKCTAPTSPHTSSIGDSSEGIGATVDVQETATVDVAGDAVRLDDATVTLGSGATLQATGSGNDAVHSYSAAGTASADVTTATGSSLISTGGVGIYVSGGGGSNPASSLDSSGLVQGNTYSIQFDDGDDTITVRTGSNLSSPSGADAGGGTDSLILIGTGTEDEVFLNFENVSMNGTDWELSGNSTFSDLDVNSGVLTATGIITSPVDINAGATLTGTGTVGTVTNSAGTFMPGDSTGTLDIAGGFTQNATGATSINFDSSTIGAVDMTGTATLDGTLTFVELTSGMTNNTTVTFLEAGSIAGSFSSIDIVPAGGSLLDYKIPTINQVGNDLQVTFLESPCRVTTGTGTFRDPDDDDTITCSTTNAPHTYRISNGDVDETVTIDIQDNASIDYTGSGESVGPPDFTDPEFFVPDTAILASDVTVTLGAGSVINSYDSQAAILSADFDFKNEGPYGGEGAPGVEGVTQNITLGANAEINVLDSGGGGEAFFNKVGVSAAARAGPATMTVNLSGANSTIDVDSGGSPRAEGVSMGSISSGPYVDTLTVNLSGDGSSIEVNDVSGLRSKGVVFSGGEYMNAASDATITLSGANSTIDVYGGESAHGVYVDTYVSGYDGFSTVNVTLSGADSQITAAKGGETGGGNRVSGVFVGGEGYYYDMDSDATVVLSGDRAEIYVSSVDNDATGVFVNSGAYDASSTALATVTLSGDAAEIEVVRGGTNGAGTGILVSEGYYGYDTTAQAVVTLETNTAIKATDVGIRVSGNAGSNPPSTIDNAGLIDADTNSIVLDDGNDTVTLRTGSNLESASGADAGAGTDTLTLIGTATEDEIFSNFENLDMDGTDWTLTGNSTFTDIDVNSGFLKLNGNIGGAVNVAEGAILGGTGTITGNVTNDGEVAPGNSIGTLNITGNFVQNADDVLTVEFDNGSIDLLNVTGSATLAGTVNFVELTAGTASSTTYTFIDAASIIGDFDNITFTPASGSTLTHAYVDIVGDDVQVTFMACTTCTFAGTFEYDTGDVTYKYCDGSYWHNVGGNTTDGACTTSAEFEYDAVLTNYKFCNGTDWIPLHNNGTLAACTVNGQRMYDASNQVYTWCNGTNWIDVTNRCID